MSKQDNIWRIMSEIGVKSLNRDDGILSCLGLNTGPDSKT